MRTRDTATDLGLLVFRVGFAALLISFHGWGRFFRAYNLVVHHQPWSFVAVAARLGFPYPTVFAVASAMAESIGALFVGLGLFTRLAALVVAFNMAIAFSDTMMKWMHGAADTPPDLPALYLLGAVLLVILGGGRFSVSEGLVTTPTRR